MRLDPSFADARYNLGTVRLQQGQAPEAIDHYEQVLRINPDSAEAHHNLGVAMLRLGRMPEAITHCEQAMMWGCAGIARHSK